MRLCRATGLVAIVLVGLGLSPWAAAGVEEGDGSTGVAEADAGLDGAADTVEGLHSALLAAMKDADRLGFEGRRELLAPVLDASFDFPFMARLALGFGWRKLDDTQQRRWVETFREFSLATYAGRFNGWSGEHFQTLDTEVAAHDTVLVKTLLAIPDEDDVSLHYRMRLNGDDWRIIDIYMNGTVSEIALRRSEFSAVLERDGFEALLAELESKIASYRKGEASA
jgi:phospholipid transport system substrate-binding protein